jgi:predicted Fe-S protein YdhL (DUF1289 family)
MIVSPCRRVCVLEEDLCIGCGRTLEEICDWTSMNDDERSRIMEGLAARLAGREKSRSNSAPG